MILDSSKLHYTFDNSVKMFCKLLIYIFFFPVIISTHSLQQPCFNNDFLAIIIETIKLIFNRAIKASRNLPPKLFIFHLLLKSA